MQLRIISYMNPIRVSGVELSPSPAFDEYWRFAAERLAMYYRRLGEEKVVTTDPILSAYRFTNTFRAADRVSQYLIGELYDGHTSPSTSLLKVVAFRFFNRIETWKAIKKVDPSPSHHKSNLNTWDEALTEAKERGETLYTAAYMLNCPDYGRQYKHSNHLYIVDHVRSVQEQAPIQDCESLEEVYNWLHDIPHIGDFLAYQMAIDLNYSEAIDFDEDDFTMAGPGARSGIRKMFGKLPPGVSEADVIHYLVASQDDHFRRLHLDFPGLYGRPLKAIDAQNCCCELDKVARVRFPRIEGIGNRTKIKQGYRPNRASLESEFFPPKWKLAF